MKTKPINENLLTTREKVRAIYCLTSIHGEKIYTNYWGKLDIIEKNPEYWVKCTISEIK